MTELLNKINGIDQLVRVDNLTVSGIIVPRGGNTYYPVVVSVENFKFDSGVHNVPINFSVVVRVEGNIASRWDVTFDKEQREFQDGWVRLMNTLQREEFKREDEARDIAESIWSEVLG